MPSRSEIENLGIAHIQRLLAVYQGILYLTPQEIARSMPKSSLGLFSRLMWLWGIHAHVPRVMNTLFFQAIHIFVTIEFLYGGKK
jgi:hypothetical protein